MNPSPSGMTEVLDRLLSPVGRCLTPEVARRLVALRADAEVQSRIDDLADRANEGELTDEERAEYEGYVRTIAFISRLQAQARRFLAEGDPP